MSTECNLIRRAPRFLFIVELELIDLLSGITIKGRTKDLSLYGCSLNTLKPYKRGTNVGIKLVYGNKHILAYARVVYGSPELGMGVAFLGIEAEYERILEGWIVQLSTVNRMN
jgi:hypothetical protein